MVVGVEYLGGGVSCDESRLRLKPGLSCVFGWGIDVGMSMGMGSAGIGEKCGHRWECRGQVVRRVGILGDYLLLADKLIEGHQCCMDLGLMSAEQTNCPLLVLVWNQQTDLKFWLWWWGG